MTDKSHCQFNIKRIYSASIQTISLLHLCQQVLESPANLKAFESKVGQAWAKEIIIDYYSRSRANILTANVNMFFLRTEEGWLLGPMVKILTIMAKENPTPGGLSR